MSRNGTIVSVELDFVRSRFKINNPDTPERDDEVELRSYGGCKSGPLVEVAPGDTLRVALVNGLSANDPSCAPSPPPGLGVPPLVGCFNTTNLHTHGLHVSPAGNSDNVLLNIAPGTSFPYEINVPADHPSGTFWYHAHRHGSTAINVASGASGVLIIRGNRAYAPRTPENPNPIADIDTILKDPAGKPLVERVFLFQQIPYACFQNDPAKPVNDWQKLYTTAGLNTVDISNNQPTNPTNFAPWSCPDPAKAGAPVSPGAVENFALQLDSPTIWDTNGRFTSINGVVQPTLTIAAGEIQRWRFIHAGIHDTVNVQVVRAQLLRGKNLIGDSALVGNREEQKADVQTLCRATPASLVAQYEVAVDGLTRASMNEILTTGSGPTQALESNYLQPGYRSDILVAFPEDGDYCLLDQEAPAAQRVNPQTGAGNGGQGPSTPQLLAYIQVRGGKPVIGNLGDYIRRTLSDANPQLPRPIRDGLLKGDLRPWAQFIKSPPPTPGGVPQVANFKIGATPTSPFAFSINNLTYDPDVVNITRQVNTTDDWTLTSQGEPHIFHIHINPFEIVDVTTLDPKTNTQKSIYNADGSCNSLAKADSNQLANQYCGMQHVFRDTIFVENGFDVKIRTTYDRYIGEYVIHCHILDHEDGGMMLNVAIVPDLSSPSKGLGMGHMHSGGAGGAGQR
jgi:FtsP/CotA-like multicopper oxidase with cupredoxin domain